MRSQPTARPLAALVAVCLMATPFAPAQQAGPASSTAAATAPAFPTVASLSVAKPGDAIQPAATADALSSELIGKTFYLRGFYQDDKLQFSMDGKPEGNPQKGSFALSALEIDRVKFDKHSMEIRAHRVGLHFFGALPYEDDSKPFERIKVDPKKSMTIEVERLVIEPEKKKKKKAEKRDKDVTSPAATEKIAGGSAPAAPAASTAVTAAAAASTVPPPLPPEHDPRISFLQLSKALNGMLAPGLDDSVIATLPGFWQNYFATKAGKALAAQDANLMRPGGEVKAPQLLTPIDATSNDYAQKNNIAGMVFLQMVVDAQGRPGAVTIVRPIGFGLDEKAVEAIQHAQFRPGTLNGKPVAELVNLQVTFRIYSNRTRPTGEKTPPAPTQVAPKESPKGPPSNAPELAAATVNE